jgi:hypothetical protein
MNRKCVTLLLIFLCSAIADAHAVPMFGLWEQLVVSKSNTEDPPERRNFIFADRPLAGTAIFSAVSSAYSGTICCLKVTKPTPIAFTELISRYTWDSDDIEHLKSVRGGSYIYEANLVQHAEQNANMRDLVSMTARAGDFSPFSAAVVSGGVDDVRLVRGELFIAGIRAAFTSEYDSQRNALKYVFSYRGKQTAFWEKPFAAE